MGLGQVLDKYVSCEEKRDELCYWGVERKCDTGMIQRLGGSLGDRTRLSDDWKTCQPRC